MLTYVSRNKCNRIPFLCFYLFRLRHPGDDDYCTCIDEMGGSIGYPRSELNRPQRSGFVSFCLDIGPLPPSAEFLWKLQRSREEKKFKFKVICI